jgi:hypothetical protein
LEPQPNQSGFASRDIQGVVSRRFGADPWGFTAAFPCNHVAMKGIFDIGSGIFNAEELFVVGLVFGEEEGRLSFVQLSWLWQ